MMKKARFYYLLCVPQRKSRLKKETQRHTRYTYIELITLSSMIHIIDLKHISRNMQTDKCQSASTPDSPTPNMTNPEWR